YKEVVQGFFPRLSDNPDYTAIINERQLGRIRGYLDDAREKGATLVPLFAEGQQRRLPQTLLLNVSDDMKVMQEEIFGPVVGVTTFKDEAEALAIANDTEYGLGAGLWTRDINRAYRMGRGIKAGRVWTNCYHLYPAHAAFGGYKKSGVGRETHKMMLDHYQQTKNLLV
uniref:aldehyde dehydrogenase family protein n=1 Tax=Enterococcus faecalis TaxID=1351 RepID=UPI0035D5D91A